MNRRSQVSKSQNLESRHQQTQYMSDEQRDLVFQRHLQGAFVRIAATVVIWLFLLSFYLFHIMDTVSFIGISVTGGVVVFFNLPFLLGLRKITSRRVYDVYNLLINIVEILGDTFIIYFLGGIKGTYLLGIYAGLVAYIGVVAPIRYSYIIASLCSLFFAIMVLLEHYGVLPHMNNQWGYHYTTTEVILIILILSATLYVLAFNASYTAGLLRRTRKKVSIQNENLEKSYEAINHTADELQLKNVRLNESMDELRQTQAQLVEAEKMAALGGLVAGVAHEINTPVGVGVTAISFLQDKINDLIDRQARGDAGTENINKFLKTASDASVIIYKNLKRAAELVKHFKQVAVDQSTETHRRFDLKEYIDGTLLSMRYQYKRSGYTIRVNCSENFVIDSYPGVFSQIITNLVMNSLTHGLDGMAHGEIVFDISQNNGYLNFQYRDNGKGMSEETVQRVFDPFYTTKRGQGGTGLGMHIVYNIVTQTLGGVIRCTSSEGNGAVFDIRIPIIEYDH